MTAYFYLLDIRTNRLFISIKFYQFKMLNYIYFINNSDLFTDFSAAFPIARRIGHPYQNRTPPKRKKPRTSFTRIQAS